MPVWDVVYIDENHHVCADAISAESMIKALKLLPQRTVGERCFVVQVTLREWVQSGSPDEFLNPRV